MTTTTTNTNTGVRIHDAGGGDPWDESEYPQRKRGESLDDFAHRCYRWTRGEMIRYGGAGSVRIVDHEWDASVVLSVWDDEAEITYYLDGTSEE